MNGDALFPLSETALSILWILLLSSLIASAGSLLMRRYAVTRGLVDVPNARSSHSEPTPRGGGVGVLFGVVAGLLALMVSGHIDLGTAVAFIGGGTAVAFVGLWDDHGHVHPWLRLLVHGGASAWTLFWLGGAPNIDMGVWMMPSFLSTAIWLIAFMWLINLFNFMDGIDGLAAGEATFVGVAAGIILWDQQPAAGYVSLTVAAAAIGYWPWNHSKQQKIFLGDVGSGLLGYLLASVAVLSSSRGGPSEATWVILLGVFVCDGTTTLLRRMCRGDRWVEAHKTHAYQRAAVLWRSHGPITFVAISLGVIWLLPMALVSARYPSWSPFWAIIALLPVEAMVLHLGAGGPDWERNDIE